MVVLEAGQLLGGTWPGLRNELPGTPGSSTKASTECCPGDGLSPCSRLVWGQAANKQLFCPIGDWVPSLAAAGSVPGQQGQSRTPGCVSKGNTAGEGQGKGSHKGAGEALAASDKHGHLLLTPGAWSH